MPPLLKIRNILSDACVHSKHNIQILQCKMCNCQYSIGVILLITYLWLVVRLQAIHNIYGALTTLR